MHEGRDRLDLGQTEALPLGDAVGALPSLPPGAFLVRGAFGSHYTEYVSVTLSP